MKCVRRARRVVWLLVAICVVVGSPSYGSESRSPNRRDQRCLGVPPAALAICHAFLAQRCDERRAHPSCPVLRRVYAAKTGFAQFPFELTPGPIVIPPPPVPLEVAQRAGAIVIYPRIVVDDERDTVVQL